MKMPTTNNVLLFGSGGALGSAIGNHLLRDGYQLFTAGSSQLEGETAHLPVSYTESCTNIDLQSFPPFDAVVWAQGLNCSDSIENFEEIDLQRMLQGNVFFVASSLRALLKAKKIRAGSRLAVLSSIWQLESKPEKFSYSLSKAALQGLIKSCALDLGPRGILINAVLPGVVDTPMTRRHLSAEKIATITSQTALGRLPEPKDVAALVSFLISPLNCAMTGQFLTVDSGFIGLKQI